MIRLIYDARPKDILSEDGREIHGGEEFTVTEERAAELLADPNVRVIEAHDDLQHLKRDELNELAGDAGVSQPGELPNKAAVVAAIENQREADSGEAQTDSSKEVM